jgi:hypothetical protein
MSMECPSTLDCRLAAAAALRLSDAGPVWINSATDGGRGIPHNAAALKPTTTESAGATAEMVTIRSATSSTSYRPPTRCVFIAQGSRARPLKPTRGNELVDGKQRVEGLWIASRFGAYLCRFGEKGGALPPEGSRAPVAYRRAMPYGSGTSAVTLPISANSVFEVYSLIEIVP